MVDIQELIDELYTLRGEFERVDTDPQTDLTGDDYREAKIDVAIEMLQDVKYVKDDYEEVGLWPED